MTCQAWPHRAKTGRPYLSRLILLWIALILVSCRAPAPETTPLPAPSTTPPPAPTGFTVPTGSPEPSPTPDVFREPRLKMVADQIEGRGISDALVLEAMRTVPRHLFVPAEYLGRAYADHPLPIGFGQTISQPYIVALMSESLGLLPGDKVLEIGTGSGYQAAILAAMGMRVYTIEIIPELAIGAAAVLEMAGYPQVQVLHADGYFGWEEFAPYDAIIVTAAPDHLPQPLPGQLDAGARLIIPIGPIGAIQSLWLFEMIEGDLQGTNLGAVSFVPFTRDGN